MDLVPSDISSSLFAFARARRTGTTWNGCLSAQRTRSEERDEEKSVPEEEEHDSLADSCRARGTNRCPGARSKTDAAEAQTEESSELENHRETNLEEGKK